MVHRSVLRWHRRRRDIFPAHIHPGAGGGAAAASNANWMDSVKKAMRTPSAKTPARQQRNHGRRTGVAAMAQR